MTTQPKTYLHPNHHDHHCTFPHGPSRRGRYFFLPASIGNSFADVRLSLSQALRAVALTVLLTLHVNAQITSSRTSVPVEPPSGGKTDIAVEPLTAAELSVPLESLLGRRVVVDKAASAVILKLSTAYPLEPDEQKAWAIMQIHAAGLMVVETPIATIIGRPEDEARLRGIASGVVGLATRTRLVCKLNYVESNEIMEMLSGNDQPRSRQGKQVTQQTTTQQTSSSQQYAPSPSFSQSSAIQSRSFDVGGDVEPRMGMLVYNEVEVTSDPRNRQIILYGESAEVERLSIWIADVDKRPQEVLIEAVIGEVTSAKGMDTGVDWQYIMRTVNSTGKLAVAAEQSFAGLTPGAVKHFADFERIGGLTAYGVYNGEIAVAVNLLETKVGFKVLQRPSISTMNDKRATIFVGQQVPIAKQTLTQGGTNTTNATLAATTEYVPVRLQIDVTPHIYAKSEVRLEISERHNDVAGFVTIGGNQVPRISEQGMDNVIVCPDGGTVLMGGLATQQVSLDKQGVPLISRIPILGRLFSRTRDNTERRQIVIMMNVKINENAIQSQERAIEYDVNAGLQLKHDGTPAPIMRDVTPLFSR